MKTTLLILAIAFNAIFSWSAPVSVKLYLKDAITNLPVKGIEVVVLSKDGQELTRGKSDAKGHFEVSIEMPKKSNEIKLNILNSNDIYASKEVVLFKGKGNIISSEISLVPSEKMYAIWYAQDDEVYGGDKEGILALEFNKNDLICGCTLSDLSGAEYKGGVAEISKYIRDEVRYPQESIEMDEQGKVYSKFIVEEDGKITHLKIERGISPSLDAEVYRLISAMPNWTPAECNGKLIRMVVRLPINFTLN